MSELRRAIEAIRSALESPDLTMPEPLRRVLPRLPSASHVVFESCTLEYVTDLPNVLRELARVAVPGGLFQVRVEPHSSTFWLYPGARWVRGVDGAWRPR